MNTDFEAARAAFAKYAGEVLGSDPDDLQGLAGGPNAYRQQGRFWLMSTYTSQSPVICAWVAADGTLITASQNLGLLAAEFDANPEALAVELIKLVEINGTLWVRPREGVLAPSWAELPGGGRALRFVAKRRQPGPGPSPDLFARFTLTSTPNGEASLQVSPWTLQPGQALSDE